MGNKRVKKKVPLFGIFLAAAILTFLASWADIFPRTLVENAYSRRVFPTISHVFGVMAGLLPISWLDIWIVVSIAILIYTVSRRRWALLFGFVSVFYLWFFWGWGLNYHRRPLAQRMEIPAASVSASEFERFVESAAAEINHLQPLAANLPSLDRDAASAMAVRRVDRVVQEIDGVVWKPDTRVKRSFLAQIWYQSAGVDGMFNPFGHEPLVIAGPLPFELPFLMSHEIAHVRGTANEGEANLIALLATVNSDDPRFRYSGWLALWDYLQTPSSRLDPGPRADLKAARDRILAHQIRFISRFQVSLLDVHLKANAVPGGIRSYSDFVSMAIASRPRWKDFE
jgi:hypothetical protein